MRAILQVALGILAAIGGFVDIGELVFNGQAGSRFGYSLVWAILVGLVGMLPNIDRQNPALYLYFAVGLIATTVSPYEVYFYSSGGVEDGWTEKDLGINRLTALLGFGIGALLSIAILSVSAEVLRPRAI